MYQVLKFFVQNMTRILLTKVGIEMSQTLNFQSLDIEISESDDEAIYTFKGDMNESFDNSRCQD